MGSAKKQFRVQLCRLLKTMASTRAFLLENMERPQRLEATGAVSPPMFLRDASGVFGCLIKGRPREARKLFGKLC